MIIPQDEQVKAMSQLRDATVTIAHKMKTNMQNSYSIFTFQKPGTFFSKDVFYIVFQNTADIVKRITDTKIIVVIANAEHAKHTPLLLTKLKEYFPNNSITSERDIPSGLH